MKPKIFFNAWLYTWVISRLPGFIRIAYHRFRNSNFFFYIANFSRRKQFKKYRNFKEFTFSCELVDRILKDLNEDGIAFAQIEELIPADIYNTFKDNFESLLKVTQEDEGKKNRAHNSKRFILPLLSHLEFSNKDIISRYALEPVFSVIAAKYLKMVPRFQGMRLWHTRVMEKVEDRYGSQNWHKDYNDCKFLKVFLYLNDISDQNGPFEFIKKTHREGIFGHLYARTNTKSGSKYEDLDFEGKDRNLSDFVINCTGKKGTVIFADTYGFHRGGYCKVGHRNMAILHFNTSANITQHEFSFAPDFKKPDSDFISLVIGAK